MKHILSLFIAGTIFASVANAEKPKVEAVIAVDKDTKPAKTFQADVAKLYAFFRTNGTEKGEKLRGVWIAKDVGDAAPKGTKIYESTLTADQDDFYGAFSLSKPTKGWPAGNYKVEIYLEDELATTAEFTIKTGKSDDESDENSDEDSSEG